MERRINKKVQNHFHKFKNDLLEFLNTNNDSNMIQNYIIDYKCCAINKTDLQKRKRVKNIVPLSDRCNALRASGEQCTRRRKEDNIYCGTHIKGIPHGEITDKTNCKTHKTKKVWAQEIKGIIYYIDNENNVYKPDEILENIMNPSIIAKYTFDPITNKYDIPDLFQK